LNTDQSAPEATPPGLTSHTFSLEPNDARNLAALCGQLDAHLRQIEKRLDITIHNRSNQFELRGHQSHCEMAATLLSSLYHDITHGAQLSPETIHLRLQEADLEMLSSARDIDRSADGVGLIRTKRISVRPRGRINASMLRQSMTMTSILVSVLQARVKPISPSPALCVPC